MKLPLNCDAHYYEGFITKKESAIIFDIIVQKYKVPALTTKYFGEEAIEFNFGKIMFIDENLFNENKFPKKQWGETAIWFDELRRLKEKIEAFIQKEFQTCVCIYYPDGSSGVAYHSDYPAFGDTTIIPSISLGEERDFYLREKATQTEFSVNLKEGSMIIMGEHCQDRYEHSLPENPIYKNPRINLTFREYGSNK